MPRPTLTPRGAMPLLAMALGLLFSLTVAGAEPEALAARIDKIITAPRFDAAVWGVKVLSLDTGRTLFAHHAQKLFTPASNAKLFTAALALHQPGPDFRIRTSLYGPTRPDPDGVLHGDLTLFGRGDPTIMAKGKGGPDPLEALADQAWAAGVRVVEGDVLGDDSFFATPAFGSGWECGDLAFGFGAEPTALVIHDNTVELRVYPSPIPGQPCFVSPMPGHGLVKVDNRTSTRVGGEGIRAQRALGDSTILVTGTLPPGALPAQLTVPLHEPALLFAQLLGRALERRGIRVRGTARAVHYPYRQEPLDPSRLVELGHLEAPPLASILRDALKDSNNLKAQLLLLQAGAAGPAPGPNTEEKGLAALATFLAGAGVQPGAVLLEEGSGLSRKDLVTPDAIVALLAAMSHSPAAATFREALPWAGLDGTLSARMAGTQAQGNLRAKTGTMRYTYALSGYVTSAAGEHLAFAILLNNYLRAPQAPSPQADLDAIAISLAEAR